MQRAGYQPLDRQGWTTGQVLAVGAIVAATAVASGFAVATVTAPATSLYAPAAVQSSVAARPAVAFNRASVPRVPTQAAAYPVEVAAGYEFENVAAVQQPVQGMNLAQLVLVPAAALVAGLAAYFYKSQTPSVAMFSETSEKESTAVVGKSYKSASRADSYYGQDSSSTVDPMKNTYEAPKGGYSASSSKSYTPTTSRDGSYLGGSTGSAGSSIHPFSAPAGGYSASNGKSYKATSTRSGSYVGVQGQQKPQGSYWYGPDRPKWLGSLTTDAAVPDYLKGEYAGDYGFDTAGFASDPVQFERYREAELQHGRWAMMGALGCIGPEWANANSELTRYTTEEPVWFKAGAHIIANAGLSDANPGTIQSIWGHDNSGNALPFNPALIFVCQIVFMGLAEGMRASAITGRDVNYPGKFFDPLGCADDPDAFNELKVKEIKNGRLAMMAMLAFYVQAIVTGKGPVENWTEHLANPWVVNGFANAGVFTPSGVAMF